VRSCGHPDDSDSDSDDEALFAALTTTATAAAARGDDLGAGAGSAAGAFAPVDEFDDGPRVEVPVDAGLLLWGRRVLLPEGLGWQVAPPARPATATAPAPAPAPAPGASASASGGYAGGGGPSGVDDDDDAAVLSVPPFVAPSGLRVPAGDLAHTMAAALRALAAGPGLHVLPVKAASWHAAAADRARLSSGPWGLGSPMRRRGGTGGAAAAATPSGPATAAGGQAAAEAAALEAAAAFAAQPPSWGGRPLLAPASSPTRGGFGRGGGGGGDGAGGAGSGSASGVVGGGSSRLVTPALVRTVVGPDSMRVEVVIDNLLPGTYHRFRVQYANSSGWSLPSPCSNRGLVPPQVPYRPAPPVLYGARGARLCGPLARLLARGVLVGAACRACTRCVLWSLTCVCTPLPALVRTTATRRGLVASRPLCPPPCDESLPPPPPHALALGVLVGAACRACTRCVLWSLTYVCAPRCRRL
jgi:hypothetical protein